MYTPKYIGSDVSSLFCQGLGVPKEEGESRCGYREMRGSGDGRDQEPLVCDKRWRY